MIPDKQVCKQCNKEKFNVEFEILSRTKLAKICLECAKNPQAVKPSVSPSVSRETSTKPRETSTRRKTCEKCKQKKDRGDFERFRGTVCEACVTSTPYVQVSSKSVLVAQKHQMSEKERMTEFKKIKARLKSFDLKPIRKHESETDVPMTSEIPISKEGLALNIRKGWWLR